MYILRADTGQAVEVNISPGTSVQALRETLASVVPIAPQDQILLLAGKRLDSNKTLEFYGLPSKEKEVFLFNRRAIVDPNFPLGDDVTLAPIETQIPSIRPLSKEYESKPLIQALKTYEHQFHTHFLIAQAIREAFERRLFMCKMCFSEQHVQMRGMDCAIINLNDHMGQLLHTHTNFVVHAKQQSAANDELLDNFDLDLARLSEVHLHPALPQGNTLLECVPEGKLRTWANDGRTDNEHVKLRIPDMENQLRSLQHDVEMENRKPPDVDFQELSDRLVHGDETVRDIVTKVQMFAKDYENVRNRVDGALRNLHNQNVGSFCDGFDEIAKVHEAHLAYLRSQDEASKENFVVFARSKAKLSRGVYTRLRAVSAYQSRVRELHNTMAVMGEALTRLKAAFTQLAVVKNMPRAYHAAIQEVSRRRGFSKKLRREVFRMNDALAKLRDEENPKRESFMNTYYYYVPKDLIPGLVEPLPNLEISLPLFDANLPPIDSDSSYEDDDFTLVPFSGDDPIPKMQTFDRENTFSQSGSTNYAATTGSNNYTYNPNSNTNPSPNVPTTPTPTPVPTSAPVPISTTKGFAPTQVSGGPASALSSSPSSQNLDSQKLQKELAASKEVISNYAERIKHLELELNKLFKEKVEMTQGAQIGTKQDVDFLRTVIASRDETIQALKADLDNHKEKYADDDADALRAKIFEQEHQINRLITALHTREEGDQLLGSARQRKLEEVNLQTQTNAKLTEELERLRVVCEEFGKQRAEFDQRWATEELEREQERREVAARYDGMSRQLTGELENLREEKLHTSRRWDNEKVELEKTLEQLKEDWTLERQEMETRAHELEALTEDLRSQLETLRNQCETLAQEKTTLITGIEKLTLDLKELQQKEADCAQELHTQNDKIHTLNQHKLTLEQTLHELTTSREAWTQEKLALENTLTDLEAASHKLTQEKQVLEATIQKLTEDKQAINAAAQLLDQEKKNLETDTHQLSVFTENLKTTTQQLTQENQDLKTTTQKLTQENQELKTTTQRLTQENQAYEAASQKLSQENQALEKVLTDLEKLAQEKLTLEATSQKLAQEKRDLDEDVRKLRRDTRDTALALQQHVDEKQALLQQSEEAQRSWALEKRGLEEAGRGAAEKWGQEKLDIEATIRLLRQESVEKEQGWKREQAELAEENRALEKTLESVQQAHEQDTAHFARARTTLANEAATLRAALEEKEVKLKAKEEELKEKEEAIVGGEEMSRSVANLSQLLETKEKGHTEEVLDYERQMAVLEGRHKQEEMDRYRMFELEREEIISSHNLKVSELNRQILELTHGQSRREQDSALAQQVAVLKNDSLEQKSTIAELQSRLKDQGITHQQELEGLTQRYSRKEAEINEISVQIQKRNAVLEKRLQDVEEERKKATLQLEPYKRAEGELKQIKQIFAEISENLRKHPACKNLNDKDAPSDELTKFQTRYHALLTYTQGLESEHNQMSVQIVSDTEQLRSLLQSKEDRVSALQRQLEDSRGTLSALEMSMSENVPNKISFSKFKDGDIVLFLPNGKFHEAFNVGCPNYFLSEICVEIHENRMYIYGQIIEISTRKATLSDNPFRLPAGTEFHEVTITSME